ncbi:hypothetical protein [Sphingomonas sp.]|jgi:hypothetical protein|nr:hypothetical protein [Sphingomonas sp.]
MFGPSSLFRSRWKALIWAAGIVWLALQVAGPADMPPSTNGSFPVQGE